MAEPLLDLPRNMSIHRLLRSNYSVEPCLACPVGRGPENWDFIFRQRVVGLSPVGVGTLDFPPRNIEGSQTRRRGRYLTVGPSVLRRCGLRRPALFCHLGQRLSHVVCPFVSQVVWKDGWPKKSACLRMSMHISIRIHMCMSTHFDTNSYVHVYAHVYMHVCAHVYVHICTHVHTHVDTHVYTHVCTYIYIVSLYTCLYTCFHTCLYTYL